MSVDLESLSPGALDAAMRGGTDGWGEWGSMEVHIPYLEKYKSRRKCSCGCGQRVTHMVLANGVGMGTGCELKMRRFIRKFKEDK